MLAAAYRLKSEQEFEKVKQNGIVAQNPLFGLVVLDRKDKQISRFGFVVSNKISNKATLRSKAKRALRESVRHHTSLLKSGYSCVFLAKQPIIKAYTSDIMHESQLWPSDDKKL